MPRSRNRPFTRAAWLCLPVLLATSWCVLPELENIDYPVDATAGGARDGATLQAVGGGEAGMGGEAGIGGEAGMGGEAGVGDNECTTAEDCPGEDTECRKRECSQGRCGFRDEPSGTACTVGGIQCDHGECVTCRVNDSKDPEETDVDCGGELCPPCAVGQVCRAADDCQTNMCLPNPVVEGERVCFPAECNDGLQNGGETGVDCGGGCQPCAQGSGCDQPADCQTGFCVDGVCCGVACAGPCMFCEAGVGSCEGVEAGTDPDDRHCPGQFNLCDADGRCTNCSNGSLDSDGDAA